ncbi:MAG: DUF393 domain-containing protein, partial [Ignavibacteriae bacterium]|nr:DUF393 domain-containing protein [Ignavibacteriota bacterium]
YKITNPESIILLKENRLYKGSEAVLSIVKKLKYPIPLLYFFVLIPKPLREFVYGYIAKRRYKWFGKRDSCMFPTDDIKSRFID